MTGTNRNRKRGLLIQPRDLHLLEELGVLRVADRETAKVAAGFGSTTRVNTRLRALTEAGLLRRFFLGTCGGRKALYALSPKGAQVAEVPCRGPRRRKNETLVADFYVEHQLALGVVYCAAKFGPIPFPHVRFIQWIAFDEPVASGLSLIPDGYVEFATPAGIDASFVEMDLGNETQGVWREKVKHYLQLAVSGAYALRFGHDRFRVLVLANSERRLHSIRKTVAAITPKIFWFATLDAIRGERFFAPVWLRPTGDTHQPLFKEPSCATATTAER
jgi:hypothetical protein